MPDIVSGLWSPKDVYRRTALGTWPNLTYRWVAVGYGGNLWTCDDTTSTTWTQQTSSFGASEIGGVASNGTDLYVAVGDAGKLATSPDGITWTQRTSSFSTSNIASVAYGNGVWVAVGEAGKLATSTDGITWTQRTSGQTAYLYEVAYGRGVWVTGGAGGVMSISTDPTSTWTSVSSTISNQVDFLAYAPFASVWVAGHDSLSTNSLASSSDGVAWTSRDPSVSLTTGGQFDVAVSDSIIVVTTAGNATGAVQVMTTTDGITYTSRTIPSGTGNNTRAVASDGAGRFFMLVDDGTINNSWATNYSTNGTTWTAGSTIPTNVGAGNIARKICHSSGTPSIRRL